ncbi:MAG: oligoendopeptidase F [bacterium]|nr:oligoendopeptidase F [bacterium]
MPEEFTWKVNDLYSDLKAWELDKNLLFRLMGQIDMFKEGWTSSPSKMLRLLDYVDEIDMKENRAYLYASLCSDADMGNSQWQAMKGELHAASVDYYTKLSFMDADILELGQEKIDEYIKSDSRLEVHRRGLESVLRMKDHILPEEQEKIMAQTSLFSGAAKKASGLLNDVDMPSPQVTLKDGTHIELNVPNYIRYRTSSVREDRANVMQTFWKHHAKYRNTHAALMDGGVQKHLFSTRTRNYKDCLDTALFPNNIDPAVYHTLVETVEDNLDVLQRYIKLKARLLGLEDMTYDDIYASAVPSVEKTVTIEEAKQMVIESMTPLGKEYTGVLKDAFNSGWMDIYPNKGKRSGAYSSGGAYDVHPYVLMNYNGTFDHISTLTHEYGHALHSWFSNKNQPYPLAHYPIFLAEVASTFNENLLIQYVLENETDDLYKLYILDRYLDDFRATLFRQTQFAHFELDMHRYAESGQSLTPDWLDERYTQLTHLYYGQEKNVTRVGKHIENEWSGISHFYRCFYVYQYSTGIIAATTLAGMVLNGGDDERERYLNFLKSGCTKYPLDTLKDAGVDLTTPQPIQTAIRRFDEVIDQMESIVQRIDIEKLRS